MKVSFLGGAGNSTTEDGMSRGTGFFRTNGVVGGQNRTQLKVVQNGTPDNQVSVGAGQAAIGFDAYTAEQNKFYHVYQDTASLVTIGANASGNPRIDALVLYVNTAAPGPTDNDGAGVLTTVAGTPAGSPSAPTDAAIQTALGAGVRWIRLANIAVANGFTSITNANITDMRAEAFVAGSYYTRIFTSGGTWTKPLGLSHVEVEVQGGGGGGGGAEATDAGNSSCGRGGGGGGYAMKTILAANLGSTETVSVGAGGAGGAAGANNGLGGGASSFGSHATGNNGAGGVTQTKATTVTGFPGADGGTGTGGDINVDGVKGSSYIRFAATFILAGYGGNSYMGLGGTGFTALTSSTAGLDGTGYGSGGGGAASSTSSSAKAGGNGANGIVIVKEFY